MKLKQTKTEWQVINKHNNCIANFKSKDDAVLFIGTKSLAKNAKLAQANYYDDEPIAENQARAIDLLHALTEEAIEALRELPSRKAWTTDRNINMPINYDNYFNELCDIQLFLLAIVLWSGLSLSEFLQLSLNKQKINAERADHKKIL